MQLVSVASAMPVSITSSLVLQDKQPPRERDARSCRAAWTDKGSALFLSDGLLGLQTWPSPAAKVSVLAGVADRDLGSCTLASRTRRIPVASLFLLLLADEP